jgi:hypothetical protein
LEATELTTPPPTQLPALQKLKLRSLARVGFRMQLNNNFQATK